MSLCFICGGKCDGEYTQMSSCIMPYSKVPYLEKITQVLGDEFVNIVNSTPNMCLKCTSLLSHMDKVENDENFVKITKKDFLGKNRMVDYENDVQSVETAKMLIEQAADKQLKADQGKVESYLSLIETPTVVNTPVKTPIQFKKIQPQQERKTEQIEKQQQNNANSLKTLKRGTCVKFPTLTRLNKKEPERPVGNLSAALKQLTQTSSPKKMTSSGCKYCSKYSNNRLLVLDQKKKLKRLTFNSMSKTSKIDKTLKELVTQRNPEKEEEEEEENKEDAEKEAKQSEASNSAKNEDNKNQPTNSEDTTNQTIITKVFVFM